MKKDIKKENRNNRNQTKHKNKEEDGCVSCGDKIKEVNCLYRCANCGFKKSCSFE